MSWRAGCSGIGACRALLPISAQTSAEDSVQTLGNIENTIVSINATLEPVVILET